VNVVAIVQARMRSTRLPGKVLKKIKNKVILDYVIERLQVCSQVDDIILATTTAERDNQLADYAAQQDIHLFRGSEDDVLRRYYDAAIQYKVDTIVRITSDCPLLDPRTIDNIINIHTGKKVDYTSNVMKRTFPRGLDVEVFTFQALENTFHNAHEPYQREHVTPYLIEHPEIFRLYNVEAQGKLRRPEIRITLDTQEDFEFIKQILLHFNTLTFTTEDVIDFLDEHPELLKINKTVKQKKLKE
jgi:spore coat polysaccharide biosynthesis protein SpsF